MPVSVQMTIFKRPKESCFVLISSISKFWLLMQLKSNCIQTACLEIGCHPTKQFECLKKPSQKDYKNDLHF